MNRHLLALLNFFGSMYGLLLLFPIMIVVLVVPSSFIEQLTLHNSVLLQLQMLAVLYLISLIARVISWLCDVKLHFSAFKRRVLLILPAVLCVAATFFLGSFYLTLFERIVFCVMAIPAFCIGSALHFRSYDEIMSRKNLYIIFAFNGGALLIFFFSGLDAAVRYAPVFAAVLLGGILLQLFSLNQGGMDAMMRLRRHRPDQLPHKIRSYNFRLVLLLVVLLLLGVLMYQPLAGLVQAAGNGLLWTIRTIVRFLSSLGGEDNDDIPPVQSEPPKEDINMDMLIPDGEANPVWDMLMFLSILLLVLVLILNGGKIMRKLVALLRRVFRRLSDWLHRSRKRADTQITDEYTDVDEEISAVEEAPLLKEAPPQPWLTWKLAYQRYRLMTASEERLRTGYRLAMEWLRIQKVPLQPSLTTLEIAQAADEALNFVPMRAATAQYNLLRYGDRSYDLCDQAELDQLLSEMARTKTAPKHSRLSRILKEEGLK